MPLKWQLLDEADEELVKKGMGGTLIRGGGIPGPIDDFLEQAPRGSKEEQLYLSLQLINNKLDYLIEQLHSQRHTISSSSGEVIDISASGLKFTTQEFLVPGSLLKMSLVMPGTFKYRTDFIAEVVRAEERGEDFVAAAKIVQIDEGTRDSIIKAVFQKQRLDIRNKKLEEDDDGRR